MPEKITLVCTTQNPDWHLLQKMLNSTYNDGCLFDNLIVHWNGHSIRSHNKIYDFTEPLSIPDAYNHLIGNVVDTEWVCCFCDDDFFYPEGLAKMIAEIHKGTYCDIAHYKYRISGYRPPQDLRSWVLGSTYDLCEKQYITEHLLEKHNRLPAGSFFRKSVWESIGGFQGDKCHDHDFWLRAARNNFRFKYFDHLVYEHVRRPNSAWHKQQKGRGL